ncbi:DUF721 domain-containing protein [Alloscardovia omnicolens]|uniref:DUF721 domain-containing protein n=1 Tax=Alloscardovia omnicolens TaxID=419015 RepID=UPI003A6071F2
MRKPLAEDFTVDCSAVAAQIFEPYAYQFVQSRSFDESNQLAAESFGQKGRDWVNFGTVLATLTNNPSWKNHMAVARLYDDWPSIVGDAIAQNCRVGRLKAGELTVFVSSPAWATQLGYMKDDILEKIKQHIDSLEITDIRFIGPQPEPYRRKRY